MKIHEFVNSHGGTVEWRDNVLHFNIGEQTLRVHISGTSDGGFPVWPDQQIRGVMLADIHDLLIFFRIVRNPHAGAPGFEVISRADWEAGVRVKVSFQGFSFRDISIDLNRALEETVSEAQTWRGVVRESTLTALAGNIREALRWFYHQVRARQPWDIKTAAGWRQNPMQASFPGGHRSVVYYEGDFMSLEALGNYTYGYLGAALGIRLWILLGGSMYASPIFDFSADNIFRNLRFVGRNIVQMPIDSSDFADGGVSLLSSELEIRELLEAIRDEFGDWVFIRKGFEAYRER